MKYWKKSNGDCGTVGDAGLVPDSVEITKAEYDEWVESIVILPAQIEKRRNVNIASKIAKKYTLEDQIALLWKLQTGELTIDSPEIAEHQQTVADAKLEYSNQ